MQVSPWTSDRAEAERWIEAYRPAGVEGLVVKGASSRYLAGQRGWVKVKSRETREVIAGAVIGSLRQPEAVVAGLLDSDGDLVIVGRTTPLSREQSAALAEVLAPSAGDHPWANVIGSGHFGGSRKKIPITHAQSNVVIEVTADTALQAGKFRHPLRFVRHRPDLSPSDLPNL
jgi:ATP-dependent DNA ligase